MPCPLSLKGSIFLAFYIVCQGSNRYMCIMSRTVTYFALIITRMMSTIWAKLISFKFICPSPLQLKHVQCYSFLAVFFLNILVFLLSLMLKFTLKISLNYALKWANNDDVSKVCSGLWNQISEKSSPSQTTEYRAATSAGNTVDSQ